MSHLPPELVIAVLEQGYYTPKGYPDHTFLANCSLVCASWSAPAQSLLFHKPTQMRSNTIQPFRSAIIASAVSGRLIGHAVRCLDVSVGRSLDEHCQPEAFVQLLEACPRLYELTLSVYGLHEFDQFALARLKSAGQGIRALYLQTCGVQSPVLFQLLGIWSHVRFLKIGTEIAAWPWRHASETPVLRQAASNEGHGDVALRPPARASLYDLALSRIPQPAVLAWLLGSSTSSLHILDLREFPGIVAREILGVHAPHLRSLRLFNFNLDSAAFLRQCTRLEEFVIYHIPTSIIPLAPELPPTIEHLSFRNPIYALKRSLNSILESIEVLPKLRIVTCDSSSEDLRQFETLRVRCAERGVEVVITDVPFWVYEDPVIVRQFPRRRSVSNFGLMTA